MFVIMAIRDDATKVFRGVDLSSGGYSWWPPSLAQAKFHDTRAEAEAVLRDLDKTDIHNITGANNHTPVRRAKVYVVEVDLIHLAPGRYVIFNINKDL